MAQFHGSARGVGRVTGDQFSRGFQFRKRQQEALVLGQWKSVAQFAENEPDRLIQLTDGIITDGVVISPYSSSDVINIPTKRKALGVFSHRFSSEYVFVFYMDTDTNVLKIARILEGIGAETIHTTGIVITGSYSVTAVRWGDYMYFTSPEIGSIYKYTPSTGVVAAVSSSPANAYYLTIVNNNLIAITLASGIWTATWSVDSLPEDFAGEGSGSNILSPNIGFVRGVSSLGDNAIVGGDRGGVLIAPTGTIPAFRFADVPEIGGVWAGTQSMTTTGDVLFYIGNDFNVYAFAGSGNSRLVGDGRSLVDNSLTACIHYSKALQKLVVSSMDKDSRVMIADPRTLQWVGQMTFTPMGMTNADYMADAMTGSGAALVAVKRITASTYGYGFKISGPNSIIATNGTTPIMDIGEEVMFDDIEIKGSNLQAGLVASLQLWINVYNSQGGTGSATPVGVTTGFVKIDDSYIYKLHMPGRMIKIGFQLPYYTLESLTVRFTRQNV